MLMGEPTTVSHFLHPYQTCFKMLPPPNQHSSFSG
nr:MAG TPA: hypothetical protein [Caudoviricetes sp.]